MNVLKKSERFLKVKLMNTKDKIAFGYHQIPLYERLFGEEFAKKNAE